MTNWPTVESTQAEQGLLALAILGMIFLLQPFCG